MPAHTRHDNPGALSRRTLLGGFGAVAAALAASPLLAACSGASTSGGGEGSLGFLSSQFSPIEERQRFETILKNAGVDAAFNPVTNSVFASTLTTQVDAGSVDISIAGGLHGDLAPLAAKLTDLDDLLTGDLAAAGYSPDILTLAKAGGSTTKYIPWMQATYVLAVNKKALEWLPSGADVNKLTYEQFLDWAVAARQANGKPVFGLPAGPKGLSHRFFQGYLLPSFTGGQITTFRSADAVTAWQYMRDLWANMNPASTNYEYMQEPLARGEVLVAWDHVARLVDAPKEKPDEWVMVPAPTGPKGLGYMLVVAGLSIPNGAPDAEGARKAIAALSKPEVQAEVLRQNAFFPVVAGELPADLPPAIKLEADAVKAQQSSPDALISVPPVGVGERDGEVSAAFGNAFREICLDGKDIAATLDARGEDLNAILSERKIDCWAPDPVGEPCMVA